MGAAIVGALMFACIIGAIFVAGKLNDMHSHND